MEKIMITTQLNDLIQKFKNQPITEDLINQIKDEIMHYFFNQKIDKDFLPQSQYSVEIIDNQLTIWPLDIYSALLLEGVFKYSHYYVANNTQHISENCC